MSGYTLKILLWLLFLYAGSGLLWRSEDSFRESLLTFHLAAGSPLFLLLWCIPQPSWPENLWGVLLFLLRISPPGCWDLLKQVTAPGFHYAGTGVTGLSG